MVQVVAVDSVALAGVVAVVVVVAAGVAVDATLDKAEVVHVGPASGQTVEAAEPRCSRPHFEARNPGRESKWA